MLLLHRTAHRPIEYRANIWSWAFCFYSLCLLIKYIIPILIVIYVLYWEPDSSADYEMPLAIPSMVDRIVVLTTNGSSMVFPSNSSFAPSIGLSPSPNKQFISEFNYNIKIPVTSSFPISAVTIRFPFQVVIRKWINSTFNETGLFTFSSPYQISKIDAVGDLMLDQTEVPSFRTSFTQYNFSSQYSSTEEIIENEENATALFYVSWSSVVPYFGDFPYLYINLKIRVNQLQIVHGFPLISYLEIILIVYLSMYCIVNFIINAVLGVCFRSHLIKSWIIPLAAPSRIGKVNSHIKID